LVQSETAGNRSRLLSQPGELAIFYCRSKNSGARHQIQLRAKRRGVGVSLRASARAAHASEIAMKWFQQNRSLGTLLIVFGICALLAAMLLFWARSKWAVARREFDAAAAERSRLQRLDPFPSAANYEKLKVHLGNYIAALDKFKEELKKEVAPAPPLAPNEFQSRLRQAVIATLNSARANNVKLPDKFQLGFDEFTTALPKTAVTPLLGQELSQMQMLINIVLDAKVDSVTSLHRAALPEEREASPTPTPN